MVSKELPTKIKAGAKPKKEGFSWRIYSLVFVILIGCVLVIGRLYGLQVKAHAFYQEMADNQHMLREKILPSRGQIFLQERYGVFPAAVNRNLATVYAVPKEIEDFRKVALELSPILSMDKGELETKLSKENDFYEVLKRKLSDDEEAKVKNLNEKGVYLAQESWRYYPGGNLAAQAVGFVGYNEDSIEGRYGVESYFEDELKGSSGVLEQERDTGGRWISIGAQSVTPAQDGDNLYLSIDHIIQFKAEMALKSAVERHSADGGKIIIMDPYSGKDPGHGIRTVVQSE